MAIDGPQVAEMAPDGGKAERKNEEEWGKWVMPRSLAEGKAAAGYRLGLVLLEKEEKQLTTTVEEGR